MSNRPSETELSLRLAQAATQITVGARYRHYKQQDYTVINLALNETNNEPCVVYRAEYGHHLIYIRPVTSWLETVEINGQSIKRFTRR